MYNYLDFFVNYSADKVFSSFLCKKFALVYPSDF